MAALSFIVGVFAIVSKIFGLSVLPGWVSILTAISFIGGVQLLVMGVIGLYIGRMYDEVKRRPLYVVSEFGGVGPYDDAAEGVVLVPATPRDDR
jgi:dolichol-phosphate mannosyltransferase